MDRAIRLGAQAVCPEVGLLHCWASLLAWLAGQEGPPAVFQGCVGLETVLCWVGGGGWQGEMGSLSRLLAGYDHSLEFCNWARSLAGLPAWVRPQAVSSHQAGLSGLHCSVEP